MILKKIPEWLKKTNVKKCPYCKQEMKNSYFTHSSEDVIFIHHCKECNVTRSEERWSGFLAKKNFEKENLIELINRAKIYRGNEYIKRLNFIKRQAEEKGFSSKKLELLLSKADRR